MYPMFGRYVWQRIKKPRLKAVKGRGAVLDPVRREWTTFAKVARTHRIGENALPDARCTAEAGTPRVNTDDGVFF